MRMIGSLIGIVFGIISMVIMVVAFIPLLGWLNWVNIPIATVGMIFSSIGNSGSGKTMCGVAIVTGTLRLMWGGGIL